MSTESKKVLLVEDEPMCAKVVKRMLEMLGCDVTHAEDGEIAVAECSKRVFNLIIMDLGLGDGVDGVGATKIILSPGSKNVDTPVVALTARDTEEDQQRCFEVGMKAFYRKPANPAILKEMLEKQVK